MSNVLDKLGLVVTVDIPESDRRIHKAHHIGAGYHRDLKDFYPTPVGATKALVEHQTFPGGVYDPCCGDGAILKVIQSQGMQNYVFGTDLYDRGYYGTYGTPRIDFFSVKDMPIGCRSIITNPPGKCYSPTLDKNVYVQQWIEHAWSLPGIEKMAMFLKVAGFAGKDRVPILRASNLKWVLVFIERVSCYKNGIPPGPGEKNNNNQVNWSWMVFEKGYTGPPMMNWITQL